MRGSSRHTFFFVPLTLSLIFIGCAGGTHIGEQYQSGGEVSTQAKINAVAYLFDVKYIHDGTRNSFRLEIYHTDTLAGLAGRGYLGKGALKGWLSEDSLSIYFPTVHEYIYEPVGAVLSGQECLGEEAALSLLQVIKQPPSLTEPIGEVTIALDSTHADHPVYSITAPTCAWILVLTYDERDEGYRLREFSFDDGHETRLEGVRRSFKPDSEIPVGRFELVVPAGSSRITL